MSRWQVFMMMGIVVFFSACMSPQYTNDALQKVEQKKDQALLFVYRPHNEFWRKERYLLFVNGKEVGLFRDSYVYTFHKDPGEYLIEVKRDKNTIDTEFSITLDMKKGEDYYLRFGPMSDDGHPKLRKVKRRNLMAEESDVGSLF